MNLFFDHYKVRGRGGGGRLSWVEVRLKKVNGGAAGVWESHVQ